MGSHTDPADLVRLLGYTPIPSTGVEPLPHTTEAFEQWLENSGFPTSKSGSSDFNSERSR
jgi:hypothetical protein